MELELATHTKHYYKVGRRVRVEVLAFPRDYSSSTSGDFLQIQTHLVWSMILSELQLSVRS